MSEVKIGPSKELALLKNNYLFSEVRRRTGEFLAENGGEVLNMGVGDIAYPIGRSAAEAMARASLEMADNERFRGYPPEGGYVFLKEAVVCDYALKGVKADCEEIFIGEGSKSDAGCFTEILDKSEVVIFNPVYPVYADSAAMQGVAVRLLDGNKENGFMPAPDALENKPYIIWLCSPSNPTGAAFDKDGLKQWVDFALKSGSVILYDRAYGVFADGAPSTVYAVDGAEGCAVEFCSFSKSAGFTGVRCSWVRIPKGLKVGGRWLGQLWARRQSAKFNGVSYVIQRGAEAALSENGRRESEEVLEHYRRNMRVLGAFLNKTGIWYTGGRHSPYFWIECPKGSSWQFFDRLLKKARIVCTPGCGFGSAGEGFFRLSCFTTEEKCAEAVRRLENFFSL